MALSRQRRSDLRSCAICSSLMGRGTRLAGLHPDCSADGALTPGMAHKRAMAFRNPCESRIIDLLKGVFSTKKQICNDEILVEGRDRGQDTMNRCRGKACCRAALLSGAENRSQSLGVKTAGEVHAGIPTEPRRELA